MSELTLDPALLNELAIQKQEYPSQNIQKDNHFQVILFCECEQPNIFDDVIYLPLIQYFTFINHYFVHTCFISRYSEFIPVAVESKIENILCLNELIKQSFVYGDKKNYLVTLLVVEKIINKEKIKIILENINKNLILIEKIKKFVLIYEEFTINNGMPILWRNLSTVVPKSKSLNPVCP